MYVCIYGNINNIKYADIYTYNNIELMLLLLLLLLFYLYKYCIINILNNIYILNV